MQLLLVILAALCMYVAVSSYYSLGGFQAYLNTIEKRNSDLYTKFANLQEEDRILHTRIDMQNTQIRKLEDRIRLQDALIAEIKTRKKK